MKLLTADNTGLLIGFWFGVILFALFAFSTLALIVSVFFVRDPYLKLKYAAAGILSAVIAGLEVQLPYTEYNLLYNYILVEGTVIGGCTSSHSHGAYEFEYFIDGERYTNCNGDARYHPEPGEKYIVRVSKAVPDIGRIDFGQPVNHAD